MAWKTQFKRSAEKDLQQIDHKQQKRIIAFLTSPGLLENPRSQGKAMKPPYHGFWRYRVGMYRIICELQDQVTIILVIEIDKRGDIY